MLCVESSELGYTENDFRCCVIIQGETNLLMQAISGCSFPRRGGGGNSGIFLATNFGN